MYLNEFDAVAAGYYRAVDEEAVRLIRKGYSPLAAKQKAGEIVRERRMREAEREEGGEGGDV